MEKLIELRKGKVFDENSKYYRFQCDCLSPEHAFDIGIDSMGKDDEEKYITITWHMIGESLSLRLKYIWQIFRNHRTWVEAVVRQEDMKNLSEIFDPNKKYSELP